MILIQKTVQDMTYGDFVGHVLGLLDAIGLLEPMRYFILFILAVAGFIALLAAFKGRA